jgi:hypothetical protein
MAGTDPKKDIKDIEKELNALKAKLDKTTSDSLTKLIQVLKSGGASLSEWNTQLNLFSIKADQLSDDLDYVAKSLADSVNELSQGDEYLNQQIRSTRKLGSIAQDLLAMRRGDTTYDLKKIKSLEEQAKRHRQILESQIDQFSGDQEALDALNAKIAVSNDLLESFENITKEAKKFQKTMGLTGGLLKGMSKIPIVGEMLNTQEALEAAEEAAKNGATRLGTMAAAAKSMGKSLTASLTDPLFLMGSLIKGFKAFLDLGFRADTEVTNLSKSMAVSKQEALGVYNNFKGIAREAALSGNEVDRLYLTTTNLTQAQLELGAAFGATRGYTQQQLKDQVLLTKQMGFEADEAAGIQQLAMSNGMTAKQVTGSIIKQTSALAKQTGIQLDNKKIIGEVAKVSGQLRLQYANNPALIAKAVVQTQKLGMSLEQAQKAAQGLLNFEESIENELSAELLTGKDLNLERARGLALNGDSAGAAEEMAKQVGTAADFTSMNVIQQEALAKAVGMSADELANSLVTRENLNNLGAETRKQIEEQIALAQQQGDQDKVNMLEKSLGSEAEAQAALERVGEQDKFNQSVEQLKSLLADVLSGPAMGLAKWITSLVSNAGTLKALVISMGVAFGAIKLAGLLSSLATAAATQGLMAAGALTWASAITLGLGIVAVIAGIAAASGAFASAKSSAKQVKDGAIDPKGGLLISGEKGSIQLDKNDSIVAGTDLFPKGMNDGVINPKGTVVASGAKGSMGGGGDMSAVISAINALANRPVNVSIDGKRVIEATTGAQSNTQGDENRKNSYKMS